MCPWSPVGFSRESTTDGHVEFFFTKTPLRKWRQWNRRRVPVLHAFPILGLLNGEGHEGMCDTWTPKSYGGVFLAEGTPFVFFFRDTSKPLRHFGGVVFCRRQRKGRRCDGHSSFGGSSCSARGPLKVTTFWVVEKTGIRGNPEFLNGMVLHDSLLISPKGKHEGTM